MLGLGYDGQTLVFEMTGLTRNNCTCYTPWPQQSLRESHSAGLQRGLRVLVEGSGNQRAD
jgi:hypothetical protein